MPLHTEGDELLLLKTEEDDVQLSSFPSRNLRMYRKTKTFVRRSGVITAKKSLNQGFGSISGDIYNKN